MYAVILELLANKEFDTKEKADSFAERWMDRLAERDEPGTWDECTWSVVDLEELTNRIDLVVKRYREEKGIK